ncbi:Zn-dependent protease [Limnobacter thiooxidans]|uniref:Site-2 protease family protein n=1 Tax=Limnobacter thiooxidans TaxID=131080 RepID=A0AA86MDA4_9BURK|nr:site-2 protease family protein [Limnobacter sp.]MCZ8015712.1 site-2 protease family protein [Limnobacter sp.]RZS42795.1 Zn-dependent protease [Limnobacter thiooxidans]BET25766.1 site-2 protease family protein [Limnobacter thiooxidans]
MDSSIIQTIAVYALPVLFAITLHEAAHGYVARMYGDNTAMYAGRITLNPLKHIDPVGTILVPIAILVSSSLMGLGAFLFGWAKPVPVNFNNLNNPKKDIRYVAFAGPGANFVMALMWALALKLQFITGLNEPFFEEMAKAGIVVNLVLAALNLLPILPLDGGRILFSLLPSSAAYSFSRTEPYGMIVLIALLMLGILPMFIQPIVTAGLSALTLLFNF